MILDLASYLAGSKTSLNVLIASDSCEDGDDAIENSTFAVGAVNFILVADEDCNLVNSDFKERLKNHPIWGMIRQTFAAQ